jgi:hypothetical protein
VHGQAEDAGKKPVKEKSTMQFMQKYYHKGAYFQVRSDLLSARRR